MAHGTSLTRPHSSPLMKLASRPKNRPIGVTIATRSASMKGSTLLRIAKARMATTTPSRPPWNDMPPSHRVRMASGLVREERRLVEQHIAQPAAQDDAERRPQQEVVDLVRRQDLGRLLADPAHDLPADDQARDIGQRIPADGERPELDQHRVDVGIGQERGQLRLFPIVAARVIASRDSEWGRRARRSNRSRRRSGGPAPLRTIRTIGDFFLCSYERGRRMVLCRIRLRRPSRGSRRSARRRASCRPTRRTERRGRSARFR